MTILTADVRTPNADHRPFDMIPIDPPHGDMLSTWGRRGNGCLPLCRFFPGRTLGGAIDTQMASRTAIGSPRSYRSARERRYD